MSRAGAPRAGRRGAPLSVTIRAALAVALWAGFWVLGLGLVGALAAIVFVQAHHAGSPDLGGLIALALAAVLAWSLRPRGIFARPPDRPEPLAAAAFPELHALVARVAREAGVAPPDEVQLGTELNASMGEERHGLRRRRILQLGLPLFGTLDEAELASVVAHELGHERGGDVALAAFVHRTHAALARTLEGLEGNAFWLDLPFRAYGWLFLRVSSAVSRAQERAADGCAAAVGGRAAAWGALRKLHDHGGAWHVYFAAAVRPALERGLRVPLLDGFARFRCAPRHAAEVQTALAAAEARAPSPHDSHPSAAERLRAVDPARSPDEGAPPLASCAHLLGGADAAEEAWYSRWVTGRPERVAWGAPAARGLLLEVGASLAGTPLELSRFTLAEVPGLVARAGSLWPSLRRGVNLLSPAAQAIAARAAISGALAMALAARGWIPELWPGEALTLRRGELAAVPDEVVAALADGSLSAPGYEELCAAWRAAPAVAAGEG